MGTAGLAGDRLEVPAGTLLQYCGLLSQRPRSASALAGILRDYFQVGVAVDQFVGKWFPLGESDLSYLDPPGLHNTLGLGAIAGDEVWNSQARFRIRVGPLGLPPFRHFLPDGNAFRKLVFLANYFVDRTFEFDVQLILLAGEVPGCRLDDGPEAPQLGWSSWLKTEAFEKDADDVVLSATDA
jgi:type VI secretion system protein ImpH